MKQIIVSLSILFFACAAVTAQNTNDTIISQPHCRIQMDMCNKANPLAIHHSDGRKKYRGNNGNTIRNTETSSFVVSNINPFRYKVEVDGQGVSMHFDTAAFSAVIKKAAGDSGQQKYQSAQITLFDLFVSFPIKVDSFPVQMSRQECYDQSEIENLILEYAGLKNLLSSKTNYNSDVKDFIDTNMSLTQTGRGVIIDIEKKLMEYQSRSTSVETLPLQVRGNNYDMVRYQVKRTNLITNQTEERDYDYYITRGWKFDFSTGIIATGLIDHVYYTKDSTLYSASDTATKKVIYRNSLNKFGMLGLTALAHFSYRASPFLKLGFCGGIAGTADVSMKYLLGGSLVFGAKNRFCLNGGYAFGKVKELDPAYSTGGYYDGSASTVPTVDVYRSNWFVGVTYSLTPAKKSEQASK